MLQGNELYITYDSKTGRKQYLTQNDINAIENAWQLKNTPASDREIGSWQESIDKIWSVIPPKAAEKWIDYKNPSPTKAAWPGFNTGKRTSEWVQRARRSVLTEKFSQINGKQINYTTNHALSDFAALTAKTLVTPQSRAEFTEITKQMKPLDLLFCIEHCL